MALYQVERAAFDLVGAVDREIDPAILAKGGKRDPEAPRHLRRMLGCRDRDNSKPPCDSACQRLYNESSC